MWRTGGRNKTGGWAETLLLTVFSNLGSSRITIAGRKSILARMTNTKKGQIMRLTRLCLLQPLNELLHLVHEDSPPLRHVPILVPLEDDLLAQHLSLVKQEHDLVEALEKVLVVVAILLDLVTQNHLALGRTCEGREQRNVVLQMLQSLE